MKLANDVMRLYCKLEAAVHAARRWKARALTAETTTDATTAKAELPDEVKSWRHEPDKGAIYYELDKWDSSARRVLEWAATLTEAEQPKPEPEPHPLDKVVRCIDANNGNPGMYLAGTMSNEHALLELARYVHNNLPPRSK